VVLLVPTLYFQQLLLPAAVVADRIFLVLPAQTKRLAVQAVLVEAALMEILPLAQVAQATRQA
jgi:hypothetical protein